MLYFKSRTYVFLRGREKVRFLGPAHCHTADKIQERREHDADLYYPTHNFVRRSGNVIDLCEYRSRMQDVQEEPVSAAPAARTERTRRRHPHQNAFALLMDSFASMSVILMTLTFTFWVLDKL